MSPSHRLPEGAAQTALTTQLRQLLNRIKAVHGEGAIINVFPALPNSAAIEVGRVWMPKADLPMVIYDQNRTAGGFIRIMEIRP